MTLEQLKTIQEQFISAIKEYKDGQDYNDIELEKVLDDTLCRLPRDVIYVEWYDRSEIEYTARQIDDRQYTDDELTEFMYELWNYSNNIMDNDIVIDLIEQTIKGE